ncbi:MAG TPA: tRNA (guanosine(46)-N7)-methyltransferase TrmB, partial [Hellea balneolensis]|nr:tRNA (guanosine(46)-N7)-methyltransferase TrmB [Hellea balneolensis]
DLSNIRLYHGDVWDILPIIPDGCVRTVHILYPDPWPKSRHFKRRLVQEDLIAQIYRVLEPGAEFRFASDIPSYVDWALVRILAHGGFDWGAESCEGWLKPYPNWPGTRYEAKALREGRTPHYLSFIKQKP